MSTEAEKYESNAQENVWPRTMYALEPGISVLEKPLDLPKAFYDKTSMQSGAGPNSEWTDIWSGWGSQGRTVDVQLKLQQLAGKSVKVVLVFNSELAGQFIDEFEATYVNNELKGRLSNGSTIDMRMRHSDAIEFIWRADNNKWMAGVLSRRDANSIRSNYRIPIGTDNDLSDESLEAIAFKPIGTGPYPTIIVNHGACGSGRDASEFSLPWTCPGLAKFFTERGYMVVFPQRRGRSKSDGSYQEGLEKDGSGYSVRIETALSGFDRALEDIHSIVDWAHLHPDVCSSEIILSGQSRGGLLSLVYANENPGKVSGVVNYVGGWVGDSAPSASIVNDSLYERASGLTVPTLWIYSEQDSYYRIDARRLQFEHFAKSGGNGVFSIINSPKDQDGHNLISMPSLWGRDVDEYLRAI